MADFSVNFDTPKTSSQKTVQVLFTVPGDSTQGYIRMRVTVTNSSRNTVYYRTISVAPTATAYQLHGTYNVAISPKSISTDTVTATYSFTYTAQA